MVSGEWTRMVFSGSSTIGLCFSIMAWLIGIAVRSFNRYSPEVTMRRELTSVLRRRLQRKAFPLLILIFAHVARIVRFISVYYGRYGCVEG